MLHAPSVVKIEVTKRSKVRRNYLSYMRDRSGKSARLASVQFDRDAVNDLPVEEVAEAPVEEVAEVPVEETAAPEVEPTAEKE